MAKGNLGQERPTGQVAGLRGLRRLSLDAVWVVATATAVLASILPLAIMVRIALLPGRDAFDAIKQFFAPPYWGNFSGVYLESDFPRHLLNSWLMSMGATLVNLAVGVPAAYTLARARLPFKEQILFFVLGTRMGPPVVFALPLFLMMLRLGLVDTYIGLGLSYVLYNVAFCIWMLHGFFAELPPEIEEAGLVDGLSVGGAFRRLALPLVAPGLVVTSVLMFIMTWNEFFYAFVLSRDVTRTYPVYIPAFFGAFQIDWGGMFAASTSGVVPPVVLGLLIRRYLVRGLTFGAIK